MKAFKKAGGAEKPRYGMVKVCWADSEAESRKILKQWWPVSEQEGFLSFFKSKLLPLLQKEALVEAVS